MQPSTETILRKQREFFEAHKTKDVGFRIEQLKRLRTAILAYENRINDALYNDLHKSRMESYTSEIGLCLAEIRYAIKHVKAWTKPVRAKGPTLFPLTKGIVLDEPYGVVLIIAPWNYPFMLTIYPLIGAIAAGDCVVLKPSELSPNTAQVIQEMIEEYFENDYITVIQGDAELALQLIHKKFDHVFYSGGRLGGKAVMKASAEHPTPVTLELGGKSPCLVDKEIDLEKTARRITWGKFLNVGQTCVAPDYLLVHKSVRGKLIDTIKKIIVEFYGEDIKRNKDYGRIVNEKHFIRLSTYIKDGDIILGGQTDSKELYIEPTLIENVSPEAKVMQEEILGPILPVIEYSEISEAIAFINSRPKPLSLYLFSNNKKVQERIIKETSSGGVCINDTILHMIPPELPFGGVGNSGFGRYHGKASFELFSNKKSIMRQTVLFDLKIRYPPYKKAKLSILRRLLK